MMSSNTSISKKQNKRKGTLPLKKTVEPLTKSKTAPKKVRRIPRLPPEFPKPDPFESSDEDISSIPSTSSAPNFTPKRVKNYKSKPGVPAIYKYRQRKNGTWVFHPDGIKQAMKLDSPDYYNLKQKKFNTSFIRNKPRQHEIEMFTPEELETPIIPLPELDCEILHAPGEKYKNVFMNIPGFPSVELPDEIKEIKKRQKLERKLNRSKGKRTPRLGKVTYKGGTLPDHALLPNYDCFTKEDWEDVKRWASEEESIFPHSMNVAQDMVHKEHANKGSCHVGNGSVDKNENGVSVPHINAPSKKMLVGVCKTKRKYNRQASGTRCQRSKSSIQSRDNEEVNLYKNNVSVVAESPLKKSSAKVYKSPPKKYNLRKTSKCQPKTVSLDELQVKSATAVESKPCSDKRYQLLPNECAVNDRILRVSLHKLAERNFQY